MTAIGQQQLLAQPAGDGAARRRFAATSHPLALGLVCGAVLAGLALRLAAARGDLWLDELWSLDLVKPLRWPGAVFWAVPHDNNHPLNSLWMALLGPDRPTLAYRLPANLFGTATVAAAARLGWRTNPAAGVAAALLTAGAYPLVLYGSEARGYAGLILAVVLAIDLWGRMLDAVEAGAPPTRLVGLRWRLAAVVLFGTASHFTMLGTAAILAVATILRLWPGRSLRRATDEAVALFRPTFLLLTPLVALVAAGALAKGGFTVGATTPFTPHRFLDGYGGLLASLLGTRKLAPPWSGLPVATALLAIGFATGLNDRRWLPLAMASLVLLPAALVLARVGNTEYPRYFLVMGLILPLLLAEMAGRLWAGGARIGAGLLVALPCLGQGPDLAALLTMHRGAPAAALAMIEPGATVLLRGEVPFAASLVAAHYGPARQIAFVPPTAPLPCSAAPGWLVLDTETGDPVPNSIAEGPDACPTGYTLRATFPSAPWSGRSWSVYRRAP